MFTNGFIVSSELSSEIAFRAFSISITTRTESDKVDALIFPSVKYLHGSAYKSSSGMKFTGLNSSLVQFGH